MTMVKNPDVLFVLMWLVGCLVTAGLVETVKKSLVAQKSKWLWRALAAVLIVVTTVSAWFGVDGHAGNAYLIPVWLIGGYYVQLVVDMAIVKKIVNAIIKAALKKKGIDTDE